MRVNCVQPAHPFEQRFGIDLYSTDQEGVGGKLRARLQDFVVEEITPDGRVLQVAPQNEVPQPFEVKGERLRFIRFTAQKMGITTLDLATILASRLRIPRNLVTYAGLKDKRAITSQAMSVPSSAIQSLPDVSVSRASFRDFEYSRNMVQIGDLWGNRFTILLQLSQVPSSDMLNDIRAISSTPLLNYFGVQRFGVTRPFTHLVGKALVKRDFEGAVRLMLTSQSEYEPADLTEARSKLGEALRPTEEIIACFPEDLRYEIDVMKHLMRKPDDFAGAIERIPPRVQTIFVHACQSFLFNRTISRRASSGMSIVVPSVGDFIISLDTTHSGRDSWLFVTESNLEERKEMVSEGRYGLAAPVPGYSTKTPPSPQTDILKEVLSQEGIRLREFRNERSRALDSPGGLHLVSLTIPDLQVTPEDCGMRRAFSLRKGSYATIVTREIMKNHPINAV